MEGKVAVVMDRVLGDLMREQPRGAVKYTALVEAARMDVIHSRSFPERMLSYKALHGALMFMSFVNLFGRLFASNQSGDFTCHTFPYYKQVDSPKFQEADQPLTPVPLHDPNYAKLPWDHARAWLVLAGAECLAAALSICSGSCVAWRDVVQKSVPGLRPDVAGNSLEFVLILCQGYNYN